MSLMLIASSVLIGTAAIAALAIAAPSIAQARVGAGAIANGALDVAAGQPTQFSAQQRSQRIARRTSPPRSYSPPRNTASPYIYPGSRGALLNCSFC